MCQFVDCMVLRQIAVFERIDRSSCLREWKCARGAGRIDISSEAGLPVSRLRVLRFIEVYIWLSHTRLYLVHSQIMLPCPAFRPTS